MPRQILDRSILHGESIELFRAAIRNPATRDPYERRLIGFLKDVNMEPDEFVAMAKKDGRLIERKIISFISTQNSRAEREEITSGTVSNSLKAIKLLLEMNDISLNWKKIRRVLPRARRYALDRIPTVEEVQQIVGAADFRGKALTLVFASSGLREGAIKHLTLGDYTHIKQDEKVVAGRLLVYSKDPDEYVTFITPEACDILDRYIEVRREHGEKVFSTSPLFRDKFDPIRGMYGHGKKYSKEAVIPITAPAVRQYYNRLLFSIGIRNQKKRRHEFSVHGFRKFFKTKAEIGGMKPINVETLMGHSTGISDSYYRPTEGELLEDYLKIVDHLTITSESRRKVEVQEINKLRAHDVLNEDAIATLSDQVSNLMQEIEMLKTKR
jgi:integrase